MPNRPEIKPGDWITIGTRDCVVSLVRSEGHAFGDCEVVFNPSKPTNHDAEWVDEKWRLADRPDYGGYADKHDRLKKYVSQLRRGRK